MKIYKTGRMTVHVDAFRRYGYRIDVLNTGSCLMDAMME